MREPYIPLFTSVVRSSLWSQSGDCIKVFLTLCAEADPEGFVSASADGIRRLADLPLTDTLRHLAALESPDPQSKDTSRDRNADGRRIERVPNGWRVVNLEWYRVEASKQAERARKRRWARDNNSGRPAGARRSARRTETETETETYKEKETLFEGKERTAAPSPAAPEANPQPPCGEVVKPDGVQPDSEQTSLPRRGPENGEALPCHAKAPPRGSHGSGRPEMATGSETATTGQPAPVAYKATTVATGSGVVKCDAVRLDVAPKRKRQLPADFAPNATAIELARKHGVDLHQELQAFRDHHLAHGKAMLDWQAALRTWIRNARKFAPTALRAAPRQPDARPRKVQDIP